MHLPRYSCTRVLNILYGRQGQLQRFIIHARTEAATAYTFTRRLVQRRESRAPTSFTGRLLLDAGGGESSCSLAVTNSLRPRADDRKWRVAETTTARRIRAPPMAGGICVVAHTRTLHLQADTAGDQRGGPRFLARASARWGPGGVFIIERDTGGCYRSNACTTGNGIGGRVAAGLAESTAAAHTCAMCAALIINTRGGGDDLAFLLNVYTQSHVYVIRLSIYIFNIHLYVYMV